MPRIFDNMQHNLLPELRDTLDGAIRADFCVGYANLRGWRSLEDKIEQFAGTDDAQCRLLVGMQTLDKDELQTLLSLKSSLKHEITGIVNYDLPWAIIRLIQRAGRIDRIGQASEQILCYSFLPADGVEKLINLRGRLRKRLNENAEVVGTDEKFFEGDDDQVVRDLYNEKSGLIDDDDDNEVDLTSEALQIWKNATDNNPELKKKIEKLQNVSFSTRSHIPEPTKPEGVLLYLRTAEGNDALAYVDRDGKSVTESQLAILRLAACEPDTPALEHDDQHFGLVAVGTEMIASEERTTGGQFGSSKSAKMRTYERLKRYVENYPLLVPADLPQAISELYRYPLRQSAIDVLNRCLKEGISDRQLVDLVLERRLNDLLCIISEDGQESEPQIICSLGLFDK
ncbi:MAG: hypothetical protein WCP16_21420 [Pseudanabaena sp. ELA645]|jgi:hypothetical protein